MMTDFGSKLSSNMTSIEQLIYVLNTFQTLPEKIIDDVGETFNQKNECLIYYCADLLEEITGGLKTCFIRHKKECFQDCTQEQIQTVVSCMAGSPHEDKTRHCLERRVSCDDEDEGWCEDEDGFNILELLSVGRELNDYTTSKNDTGHLNTLKHLRALNLFQKQDISDRMLYNACRANGDEEQEDWSITLGLVEVHHEPACESIFNYLVEWNPTVLIPTGEGDDKRNFLLQNLTYCNYPLATIKMVLKAGLKYFPNKLGFLLNKSDIGETPISDALSEGKTFGTEKLMGWTIIEECLEEVGDLKLYSPDPSTNLYPFMYAATDQSCRHLDLVYYLLREDPSVLLGLNVCGADSRKRKTTAS